MSSPVVLAANCPNKAESRQVAVSNMHYHRYQLFLIILNYRIRCKYIRIRYEGKIGERAHGNSGLRSPKPYSPVAQRFCYLDFDPGLEMDAPLKTPEVIPPSPDNVGADGTAGVLRRGRKKSVQTNRTNGNKRIFIRVLPEEQAVMAERAAEAGLTVSEFIRRIALGYKTQSRFDYDVIEHLIRMHTDMNRLGNLFKLSLKRNDDGGEVAGAPLSYMERQRHRAILDSIEDNQELLRNFIGGFTT